MPRKHVVTRMCSTLWQHTHSEQRDKIEKWRLERHNDPFRPYMEWFSLSITLDTLKSFLGNINIMSFIHIIISVSTVAVFQHFNVAFDIPVALFISPIVFPLAFSINSDFQRRERVLEDLAAFKSAGLSWYFCMREWKQPAGLDAQWMTGVREKLVSMLFLLSEYLLTTKSHRRKIILLAMYEDFREANELNEKLRASKLPHNTAIVSRSVHFVHLLCLSFERLRIVRDYRSPRSIRSFNKVFIVVLLLMLSPYFVYLGVACGYSWMPYLLAVVLALIFSILQGIQDKLDDPFDCYGEDDINVDTIDEWAPILETMKRTNSCESGYLGTQSESSSVQGQQDCHIDAEALVTDVDFSCDV